MDEIFLIVSQTHFFVIPYNAKSMNIKRPDSKQPIPKNAQRVFKGKIFDVYQWEQRLFDGSKATFEKIKRTDTVNVIPVTAGGKLILTQQKQPGGIPFIGVLGGRIDEGESPLAAAKRELMEEAGMQADSFVLWDAEQLLDKIDWAIYTFIAKGCERIKKQAVDAGEKIRLIEVTFEEFVELLAKDNYRDLEIVLKVLRATKNPVEFDRMRKIFS